MKRAAMLIAGMLVTAPIQATTYVATYQGVGTSGTIVGQHITLSFRFTDAVGGNCCTSSYFERDGSGSNNPIQSVYGSIDSYSFNVDFGNQGHGSVAQYDLSNSGTGLADWLLHHARIEGQYYFNANLRAEFVGPAPAGQSLSEFDYFISPNDETYGLINGYGVNGLGTGQFRATRVSLRQVTSVPEPETWLMLLIGMIGIGAVTRTPLQGPPPAKA